MSNEAYKAMQDYIKIMRAKLNELKKKRKSRKHMSSGAVLASTPSTSTPAVEAHVGGSGSTVVAPAQESSCVDHTNCLYMCKIKCRFWYGLDVAIDFLKKLIYDVGAADMERGLPIQVDNPPRSRVKGRKKEKRLKKGMNVQSTKRKNRCSRCKSTEHNIARCPKKAEEGGLT
jgi:hypothetical protein